MGYPKVDATWQSNIASAIKAYDNSDLLDYTISAAQGDDWDGSFTSRGSWEFAYLQAELYNRLKEWLEQ